MKKIFGIIITLMLNITILPHAMAYSGEFPILTESIGDGIYLTNFFGEEYFFFDVCATSPRKYEKNEYDFFLEESKKRNDLMYDYIKAGDYYMARQRINDFTPDSFKYRQKNHLFIYNSNFELVKDCIFDNYVSDMGYYNGNFYVELYNTAEYNGKYIVQKTNDFENWVECDEGIPIESNGIYVTSNKAMMKNGKVYDIEKEADHTIANKSCGKFLWTNELLTNDGKRPVIITIDNIYNYKLINDCYCHFAYQYDDKIYFTDNLSQVQQTVSLDEINNILEPFKNAPYVIYNDKILAFEQPPVIQDDRTLIPIRFLFEQMGATVDWDGETRTATIAQNDRTITFSIDNTTATVNGQPAQMDVPARLISGKTMVPLRFLSENLGYTVDWDGENRIITIGS